MATTLDIAAKVEGLGAVQRILDSLDERLVDALSAALYQEGQAVLALAVGKCPVDTGRLRSTGYVGAPERERDGLFVEVGFGTDYAVYVHERTELAHKVGEAKYLEKALFERSDGFLERLTKRARALFAQGIGVRARAV